jgi:hypothetical protein
MEEFYYNFPGKSEIDDDVIKKLKKEREHLIKSVGFEVKIVEKSPHGLYQLTLKQTLSAFKQMERKNGAQ